MRLSILLVVLFIACSDKQTQGVVLPPEKMKKVLFDIIRTDEYVNNYLINDTTVNLQKERVKLYEKVFVLHKTDHKSFYSSYKYYQQHPDLNKQLFDSLSAYANRISTPGLDTLSLRKPVSIQQHE